MNKLSKCEIERARKADLGTLPPGITGTNCANCEYSIKDGDKLWCAQKNVQMHVTKRMCCAFWDSPGFKRV